MFFYSLMMSFNVIYTKGKQDSVGMEGNCTVYDQISLPCRLQFELLGKHKIRNAFILICFYDLILYVPSTIFQLCRDRSSWVEPVLS